MDISQIFEWLSLNKDAFATLGVIVTIIGTLVGGIWALKTKWPGPDGRRAIKLQIVSLSIIERPLFPILDIKLLNSDEIPALIYKLELVILSSKTHFKELSTSPPFSSSHIYNILIDPIRPKSVSKELSFVVNPKSADRFHVVVGAKAGGILEANEVLQLDIPNELRSLLEAERQHNIYSCSYKPKAVVIEAVVRLQFNETLIVESKPVVFCINIDPHFEASQEEEIVDNSSYIDQISESYDSRLAESIEILGHIELDQGDKQKTEQFLYHTLKSSTHIPVLVEAAAALMRLEHDAGEHWLIDAAKSEESGVWLRVYAIRTLIRLNYFDRDFFVALIKSKSIPVKLEVLRVVGHLQDNSIISELESLFVHIDDVVKCIFNVYVFSDPNFKIESFKPPELIDARKNKELEEIVRVLGSIGDLRGLDIIMQILNHERTYRELSYELLISCINSLMNFKSEQVPVLLQEVRKKLQLLPLAYQPLVYQVENAISEASKTIEFHGSCSINYRSGSQEEKLAEHYQLINAREDDDFEIHHFTSASVTEWLRGSNRYAVREARKLWPHMTSTHFHNSPPSLYTGGKWRTDPRFGGKFTAAGYPDDLQVIIHDGGPRITDRPPELPYVRVISCVDDNVYRGYVLNKPHQLQTVKKGDLIMFTVPLAFKWPIYITRKYFEERVDWEIHPCTQCGMPELFDAPSDLLRILFPNIPSNSLPEMFTTLCPGCGKFIGVERKI